MDFAFGEWRRWAREAPYPSEQILELSEMEQACREHINSLVPDKRHIRKSMDMWTDYRSKMMELLESWKLANRALPLDTSSLKTEDF